MYNMINIIDTVVCSLRQLLRVNPEEFSSQGKHIFFYFLNFVTLWDDGYSMTDWGHHFMMYVSHIIMLYTLNLHSAACQFYVNKTGRKKEIEGK